MVWAFRTSLGIDDVDTAFAIDEPPALLGLAEEAGITTAYFTDQTTLDLDGTWEYIKDEDWQRSWRAGLRPIQAGAVVIRAPWHEASPGEINVVIDPGQAFGTGHHETTLGCALALQDLNLEGASVLDVGTGTGVLAIIAAKLGAASVTAVDTDPLAVDAARSNALANDTDIRVADGTVIPGEPYDAVVANLDTATLIQLADDLGAALAPGGTLIASGISLQRLDAAVAALVASGLRPSVTKGKEWAVVVCARW